MNTNKSMIFKKKQKNNKIKTMSNQTTNQAIYALYYAQIPMMLETIGFLHENTPTDRFSLQKKLKSLNEILERDYLHLIGSGDQTIDSETEKQMIQFQKAIVSFINASENPEFYKLLEIIKEFHQGGLQYFDKDEAIAINKDDFSKKWDSVIKNKGVVTKQLLINEIFN